MRPDTPSRVMAIFALSVCTASLTLGIPGAVASNRRRQADCTERALQLLLTPEFIKEVRREVAQDPASVKKLRRAVQKKGIRKVTLNEDIVRAHNDHYNHELTPVDIEDQQQAGTCWDDSGCTRFVELMKAQGKVGKDFQLSQGFVYFWTDFEKADKWFFDLISRLKPGMKGSDIRPITNTADAIDDGGFTTYFNFVGSKYGLVPLDQMKHTVSSQNTTELLADLKDQMAGVANEMVSVYKKFEFKHGAKELTPDQIEKLQAIRAKGMKGIYRILVSHLGEPPGPDEPFTYRGKDGKPRTYTAKTFARDFVGFDPDHYVLVAVDPDPGLQTGKAYAIPDSTVGVPDPKDKADYNIRFLNVTSERARAMVEKSIDQKEPVPFDAEIERDVDLRTGIMHPDIFKNKSQVYGLKPGESGKPVKSARKKIFFGLSTPDHQMVIMGYDRPGNGPTVKYKDQNSWGMKVGSGGIFHLYVPWFDQYVYMVEVPRSVLTDQELQSVAKPEPIKEDKFF